MALQMSLMGPMPLTKDNLRHIIARHQPVDVADILKEMGYDRADTGAWSKAFDEAHVILQEMCKRNEGIMFRCLLDGNCFIHRFSTHYLPNDHGHVSGWEPLDPDGDAEEDEDMDACKRIQKSLRKEVKE